MADERSRHLPENVRHRRHRHSHHPKEQREAQHEVDEQPGKERHHRHRHRHSRRSLSPGEIPPPKRHRTERTKRRHDKPPNSPRAPPLEKEADIEEPSLPVPVPDDESSDSEEILGPMPTAPSRQERQRPLRRGEFGYEPKDIERFEQMGFVMSGNRRKRNHAQNIDEASRKANFKLQKEEKALRETELVAQFKAMIEDRKGKEAEN